MSDVLVAGGGIVGLCAARACAARGLTVTLLSNRRAGEASSAAGGILSSTIADAPAAVNAFAAAARDGYPPFVRELEERTGVRIALNTLGILEVAQDDAAAARLEERRSPSATWLAARDVAGLEPELALVRGALLHEGDGAVDNVSLLAALRLDVERDHRIRVIVARALRIRPVTGHCMVDTDDGGRILGERLVLALGAWSAGLHGLPRSIPVAPLRGQIVTLGAAPLRRVCYGAHRYLVPRPGGHTLVGSTMESVGFAPGTTDAGVADLIDSARELVPSLRHAAEAARWSGLRPATPDLLPIIGPDPDARHLLYACGHSRNGILLGPLTGEVIGEIAAGRAPRFSLEPFRVDRFAAANPQTQL